jgi:hypothetical protein
MWRPELLIAPLTVPCCQRFPAELGAGDLNELEFLLDRDPPSSPCDDVEQIRITLLKRAGFRSFGHRSDSSASSSTRVLMRDRNESVKASPRQCVAQETQIRDGFRGVPPRGGLCGWSPGPLSDGRPELHSKGCGRVSEFVAIKWGKHAEHPGFFQAIPDVGRSGNNCPISVRTTSKTCVANGF